MGVGDSGTVGAQLVGILGWDTQGLLGLSWWVYWGGILKDSWGSAGGYIGVGYSGILGAQLVGILVWWAWWGEEKNEEEEAERIFT